VSASELTIEQRRVASRNLTIAEWGAIDAACECSPDERRDERCSKQAFRCKARLGKWLDACDAKVRAMGIEKIDARVRAARGRRRAL
jgi:hypothetical protein